MAIVGVRLRLLYKLIELYFHTSAAVLAIAFKLLLDPIRCS